MYNIDFLPQLQRSEEHLFGRSFLNPREVSDEFYPRYSPLKEARILECKEDSNGEFVPIDALEKVVETN